jgi:predicted O-methyltransferase YrrM
VAGRVRAALSGRRRADDPRAGLEPLIRAEFGALDPAVIDGFFANFGFSMALSLVRRLVELVAERRPRLVVEVGSGISTVALNGALAGHGGYLVSLEQNVTHAAATARALPSPDLVALVCITGAADRLAKIAGGWEPGLVVVDGPAGEQRFSEPWLAFYRAVLSPGCLCAIDDTDRGENDAAAALLADAYGFRRWDFDDPVYARHRYSLLLPPGVEP